MESTLRTALLTGMLIGLAACIDVQSVRMPPGTGVGGGAGTSAGIGGSSESWTGYVEQYSFRSGSATLKLTFSTNAQGVAVGAILFGQGVPPPPATDPTVGYPPDFLVRALDSPATNSPFYIAEGYAYMFDAGMLEGQRLQFTVNLSQLWSDWCGLQVSPGPGFGPCFTMPGGVPGGSFVSGDLQMCWVNNTLAPEHLQVNCGQFLLCENNGRICSCTTSGCGPGQTEAVFDLFVTGGTISGSVQAPFGMYNVHFLKD